MLGVSIHCPEATTPQGCEPEARSKAVNVCRHRGRRHSAALSGIVWMLAFPVLPVRVCTSATRGRVLDFPSLVRLSVRHVLRHKALERTPSTVPAKGSGAGTAEGWQRSHEPGCCGLLLAHRLLMRRPGSIRPRTRWRQCQPSICWVWEKLSPKALAPTTDQVAKPNPPGSRWGF